MGLPAVSVEKMSLSRVSPTISKLSPILLAGLQKMAGNELWESLTQGDPLLLAELRRDGLTPLIYMQLLSHGLTGGLNPTFLAALQHDYYCSFQAAAYQEQEALRVFQDLNKAGVEFILLKGADLRMRVYQDPAQRPMVDLDLLISRQQLPQAQRVLTHLGYRLAPASADPNPGFRELFFYELAFEPSSAGSLFVDLHWEIRAVAGFYRLPLAPLRDQAILSNYQGVPVKLLSPEHLLIHLCLHMYADLHGDRQSCYNNRQVLDLALVLARLPVHWPQLLKDIGRFQCQAPLLSVLSEMRQIFPDAINPTVLSALSRHRPKLAERMLLSQRLGYLEHYLAVFHHEPFKHWPRYLAAKLWPDPEYLLQTLGSTSRMAYLTGFLGRFRPRSQ